MSLNRYNAKRDAAEAAILQALRDVGADYLLLDAFDALVWWRGRLTMIDAKGAKGKPTKGQQQLIDRGWPLRFVHSPQEALTAIGWKEVAR